MLEVAPMTFEAEKGGGPLVKLSSIETETDETWGCYRADVLM